MAALTITQKWRARAVATTCAIVIVLAPVGARAQDAAGVEATLAAAVKAFDEAEFEKVRDLAREALTALDGADAGARDPRWRTARASAYDLLAQAQFNLGDKPAMFEAIDRMLTTEPGRRVDPARSSAKFVAFVEERRGKLVGRLAVTCAPLPCDAVVMDGEVATLDGEGKVSALAGQRTVILRRRNFRDHDAGVVTITPGGEAAVGATLEQIARDLTLVTEPAGATVVVDGQAVGVTAPGAAGDAASQPLTVPSLAPAAHVVVVQAPCRRRVEQSVEVVLDGQDLQPIDLGVIQLERAGANLELKWSSEAGVLSIDGQPVEPGRTEVCPGEHDVSLAVGGRRVWFEKVDLKDEETRSLAPAPRPTVALWGVSGGANLPGFPGRLWSQAALAAGPAEELLAALDQSVGLATAPVYPEVRRVAAPGAGPLARSAAPESDIIVLAAPGRDRVRSLVVLVLLDPRREFVELTAWPETDTRLAAQIADEINRQPRWVAPQLGFDAADRVGRAPVVAAVLPESPAAKAGVERGQALLSINGKPLAGGVADLVQLEAGLHDGEDVVLRVADLAGAETEIKFRPAVTLAAPNPATLRWTAGMLLMPMAARAAVARLAGTPAERVAGVVVEALTLAAMGLEEDAATALDRAAVDEDLDPAADIRGSIAYTLERLLVRMNRRDYAREVRNRWTILPTARLGGRVGPPLSAAADAPED